MGRYDVLQVTLDDGRADRWEARKNEFDEFYLDGGALIVKKDGVTVGVYSLPHLMSAALNKE